MRCLPYIRPQAPLTAFAPGISQPCETWSIATLHDPSSSTTPSHTELWGIRHPLGQGGLLAVIYLLSAQVSLRFTTLPGGDCLLWLPDAALLTGLLLSPVAHWPVYIAAVLPAEWLVARGFAPFAGASVYALSSVATWVLAAATLRKFCGGSPSLRRLQNFAWFVLIAGVLGSAVSTFAGTLLRYGSLAPSLALWRHWAIWWLGDSLGLLMLVPILIDFAGPRHVQEHVRLLRSWNWALAMFALLGVSVLVFAGPASELPSIAVSPVVVMPLTVWVALRHGLAGAVWAAGGLVTISSVATAADWGPFAASSGPHSSLLLQEYLLICLVSTLGFGAVMFESSKRREASRIFLRALEASGEGVTIADARAHDCPLVYVNPKFELLTGYGAEEILGRNCRFLSGEDRAQSELDAVRRSLMDGEPSRVILRNYRKDGSMFWNQLVIAPVRDDAGDLSHFIGIQHDVSDLVETQAELRRARDALEAQTHELEKRVAERTRALEQLAVTDVLTGIPNRRYLMDHAQAEVSRAQRYQLALSMVLIDLDDFKQINDRHGHAVGDQVLSGVCRIIEKELRPSDTLARYGGEEFALLLPNTGLKEAGIVAERIRARLAEAQLLVGGDHGAGPIRITASFGVSSVSATIADLDRLFTIADHAMYAAKHEGRNRVVTHTE